MLAEKHPDLFDKAVAYEQEHKDGRTFTWNDDCTLLDLLNNKERIIEQHKKYMKRELNNSPNKPLTEALADVLDLENGPEACLICHL